MELKFKGMVLHQKQYVSKAGHKGNSILFIDVATGKQFEVSSKVVLPDKDILRQADFVLTGSLGISKTGGLYYSVEDIAGVSK